MNSVSCKPFKLDEPDVGAAVLLELGGGPALDEGGGIGVMVVLDGVEPLPPMLALLVVSVGAVLAEVDSEARTEEVAVGDGSVETGVVEAV